MKTRMPINKLFLYQYTTRWILSHFLIKSTERAEKYQECGYFEAKKQTFYQEFVKPQHKNITGKERNSI